MRLIAFIGIHVLSITIVGLCYWSATRSIASASHPFYIQSTASVLPGCLPLLQSCVHELPFSWELGLRNQYGKFDDLAFEITQVLFLFDWGDSWEIKISKLIKSRAYTVRAAQNLVEHEASGQEFIQNCIRTPRLRPVSYICCTQRLTDNLFVIPLFGSWRGAVRVNWHKAARLWDMNNLLPWSVVGAVANSSQPWPDHLVTQGRISVLAVPQMLMGLEGSLLPTLQIGHLEDSDVNRRLKKPWDALPHCCGCGSYHQAQKLGGLTMMCSGWDVGRRQSERCIIWHLHLQSTACCCAWCLLGCSGAFTIVIGAITHGLHSLSV